MLWYSGNEAFITTSMMDMTAIPANSEAMAVSTPTWFIDCEKQAKVHECTPLRSMKRQV